MMEMGDILILGLGRSGRAAVPVALQLIAESSARSVMAVDGAETDELVRVADEFRAAGVRVTFGATRIDGHFDVCVTSPGIPPEDELMRSAAAASERVISEVEFAFQVSTHPWAAVTGTNGKTTTTALLTHLLNAGGIAARSVGNFGPPAVEAAVQAAPSEVLVAEVSSFQLAYTQTFHPRVAVLLNITPDHLNWHGSLESYSASKARIFENLQPGDTAVVNVDDEGSRPFADVLEERGIDVVRVSCTEGATRGAHVGHGMLELETRGGTVRLVDRDELQIRGAHNVANALAAAAAAHALGVPAAALRAGLTSFEPIEHRLEPVTQVDGVEWFNDSKATNPEAVLVALTAFVDRPFVILLGGRNKDADFRPLATAVSKAAKAAVLFGEAREMLAAAFRGLPVHTVEALSLSDACEAARSLAEPGDAVLLSPACKSFDEFTSYEHRGETFKTLVTRMAEESA